MTIVLDVRASGVACIRPWVIATVGLALLWGPPVQLSAQQVGSGRCDLNVILDAWRAREAATRSMQFKWRGTHFEAARPPVVLPFAVAKGTSNVVSQFPVDKEIAVEGAFVVDRSGRMRLSYDEQRWSEERQMYVPYPYCIVHDAAIGKLCSAPREDKPYRSMFVGVNVGMHGGAGPITKDIRITPLWLAYRPADAIAEPEATGEITMIGKTPCCVLTHTDGIVHVDPEIGYLPVRYINKPEIRNPRAKGIPLEIHITYAQEASGEWYPSSWKYMVLGDGKIIMLTQVSVDDFQRNCDFEDSLFDIPIEPGTMVTNLDDDECYIAREGGRKRRILPGEYDGTNYEELRRTEEGELARKKQERIPPREGEADSRRTRFMIWTVNLATLGIFCAALGYRAWKRRNAT